MQKDLAFYFGGEISRQLQGGFLSELDVNVVAVEGPGYEIVEEHEAAGVDQGGYLGEPFGGVEHGRVAGCDDCCAAGVDEVADAESGEEDRDKLTSQVYDQRIGSESLEKV